MDVTLDPGCCHAFHKHPDQDEMIIVKSGRSCSTSSSEHAELGPGRLGLHRQGRRARLLQRLRRDRRAPGRARAGDGRRRLRAVDVSGEEPWVARSRCRPFASTRAARSRYETSPDPVPGPGEVLVELRCGGAEPPRLARRPPGRVPVPAAADPGLGRGRRAARHGRGGRRLLRASAGAAEDAVRADRRDPRRPARRHLRRAGRAAGREPLPEAGTVLVGGGRRVSAGGADRLPGALHAGASATATRRVLVLGAGSGVSTFAVQLAAQAGARVLVTSSSDEKIERAQGARRRVGCQLRDHTDWPAAVKRARRRRRRDRRGRLDLAAVARLRPRRAAASSSSARPAAPRWRCRCGRSTSASTRCSGRCSAGPTTWPRLLRMIDVGSWRPVIDSVSPLADAPAALERMVPGAHSASWC